MEPPRTNPRRGAAGTTPRNETGPAATRARAQAASGRAPRSIQIVPVWHQPGRHSAGGRGRARQGGRRAEGRRIVAAPAQAAPAGVGPAGAPLDCQ